MGATAPTDVQYFCISVRISNNMGNYVADFSSASGGEAPRTPPGLRPWTPLGDFRPPGLLVCPQPLLSSDLTQYGSIAGPGVIGD